MNIQSFANDATQIALGNLQFSESPELAAEAALEEAHAQLDQRVFFETLDALGGQKEAVRQIARRVRALAS